MRSPQRTDCKFDGPLLSMYSAVWLTLARKLRKETGLRYGSLRVLTAVDALHELYGWRMGKLTGVTPTQISRLVGLESTRVRYWMDKHVEGGWLVRSEERGPKRVIYRYKLTRKGKTLVNRISGDMDRVNEAIVDHLYARKLLKH